MKYPCLVLDHDDTVVQTMRTLSYPFFLLELEQFRPGATMSLEEYILDAHRMGFAEMCRTRFHFTDEEMTLEHNQWKDYIRQHIPDVFSGIDRIIRRQKESGGMLCVVSHSNYDTILRDYRHHFGITPDAIYGWDLEPYQRKPNPWPLEDIMAKYGFQPQEILVVDDMKLACQMAAPLGVQVAYAGWDDMGVPELREEMKKLCAYSFDSTKELEKFLFD